MKCITYLKFLQNIETIKHQVAHLPLDLQHDMMLNYYGNDIFDCIANLAWVPEVVQELNVNLDWWWWSMVKYHPDIVTFKRFRFFRYMADATVWKLAA